MIPERLLCITGRRARIDYNASIIAEHSSERQATTCDRPGLVGKYVRQMNIVLATGFPRIFAAWACCVIMAISVA
ncbi:hypothetical protein CC80DRAFT_496171 [Byssothecium circinans]|uniref:Uncharacterized protein n=1 Tax=Byssothecium circinans TaxID=147558 RepID=A0A6A5TFK5_9PLEO|nr:hypothetical protein CC80DRAFT_496171 [Byssothecium circinans]